MPKSETLKARELYHDIEHRLQGAKCTLAIAAAALSHAADDVRDNEDVARVERVLLDLVDTVEAIQNQMDGFGRDHLPGGLQAVQS